MEFIYCNINYFLEINQKLKVLYNTIIIMKYNPFSMALNLYLKLFNKIYKFFLITISDFHEYYFYQKLELIKISL